MNWSGLPDRARAGLLLGGAAAVAGLVVFGAVMPAEFHKDPLGLGRRTGLDRLWRAREVVQTGTVETQAWRGNAVPLRDDVVTIRLAPAEDPDHGDEIEYKVASKAGASFVYDWTASGAPTDEEFYTEFHGHTLKAEPEMTVAYYRKDVGRTDRGVLTAPFDGVHGWYFQNQSLSPVTVTLHVAGFYDLVAPGKPGNERGLVARPVSLPR